MNEFVQSSIAFGVVLSLSAYEIGVLLQRKTKKAYCNPLLISILIVIAVLLLCRIDYVSYQSSAKYLSYLLTPATVCLAIPLYQKVLLLKQNWKAIIGGILAGALSSLVATFVLAILFRLDHAQYVTILPKSITTAIGIGITEELGGYATITVVLIVMTGVVGNVMAEWICKTFHINHPIAKGVAIGTGAHALGTTKALEMGQTEGAMSSLSIVVCGIITVILAPIFAGFI